MAIGSGAPRSEDAALWYVDSSELNLIILSKKAQPCDAGPLVVLVVLDPFHDLVVAGAC